MAKWQDLPLELKEKIVDMVDEKGNVRAEVPYGSRAARATLCALSLVSREAWQLAARVLWQTFDLDLMSAERLQAWRAMSAGVARFIKSTKWTTNNLTRKTPEQLGFFDYLAIPAEGRWFEVASALPSHVRESIEDLTICSGRGNISVREGSSWDAAILVQGFPLIKSLRLDDFYDESSDGGRSALIGAIQNLCHLKTFTSWYCTTLAHPSLSNNWQGPVADLCLRFSDIPMPLLRNLIISLGDTLQSLTIGIFEGTTPVPPLPSLPSLHSLCLNFEPAETSAISSFLVNLHLRKLDLIFVFEEWSNRLNHNSVAPFLLASATLQSLSISYDGEASTDDMFPEADPGKLQKLAGDEGVTLSVITLDGNVYSDEEPDFPSEDGVFSDEELD